MRAFLGPNILCFNFIEFFIKKMTTYIILFPFGRIETNRTAPEAKRYEKEMKNWAPKPPMVITEPATEHA